jgi:hypothetical protein
MQTPATLLKTQILKIDKGQENSKRLQILLALPGGTSRHCPAGGARSQRCLQSLPYSCLEESPFSKAPVGTKKQTKIPVPLNHQPAFGYFQRLVMELA